MPEEGSTGTLDDGCVWVFRSFRTLLLIFYASRHVGRDSLSENQHH